MAASLTNMLCRISLQRFLQNLRANRSVCTCQLLQNDVLKSKTMQKLLSKQKNKKIGHIMVQTPGNLKVAAGPKPTKMYRRMTAGAQKRLEQIGAIYHEHINQIFCEGEVDIQVAIMKVQVVGDMSSVNVFWVGEDDAERDGATQQALDESAGHIRHTLQTRNILGYVPKILFIKDLSVAKEEKLDEIFTRLNLNLSVLPDEHKPDNADNEDSAAGQNVASRTEDKFRQDVYGLQHDDLMQKVKEAKLGKPVGPEIVVGEVDTELMTKAARREYVQKFSKHLKDLKVQKKKEKRIQEYISEHYGGEGVYSSRYDDDDSDVYDNYGDDDHVSSK